MRGSRVVVVGAGIGGLVAALELAHAGAQVQVVESAGAAGGKLRPLEVEGQQVDAGPTVFTMRWVFEELMGAVGESLDAHVALRQANILARHAWNDEEHLDLFACVEASADAIGRFAGAAEARGYRRFCQRAQLIYRTLEQPFLRSSRPNPLSLIGRGGLRGLPDMARISPFGSMWQSLGGYFRDPRLRQLFGRYATYCGSSPYQAPATLMLVAHVEQEGVWFLGGGMHRLATALETLAVRRGARFSYGTPVAALLERQGRAAGVRLASGACIEADAVVFNGDADALSAGLLGAWGTGAVRRPAAATRSLSAVTWTGVAPATGFALKRHNVFFSTDYAAEFDALFRSASLPGQPTVYVCAQDREGLSEPAPGQPERLLCLVNAPATGDGDPPNARSLAQLEAATFERLARCGLQVSPESGPLVRTTPTDFARLYPGTGGALYGRASHGWMTSFRRPGARSRLPGLYLAGGSTHPGAGVPMAALSGRQAAASVLSDFVQMRPRRPA